MREFRTFSYRGASYRISTEGNWALYDILTSKIMDAREELEAYIKLAPEFLTSLKPVELHENAPRSAQLMAEAANLTGTGPMAAVAGTIAQTAVLGALDKFSVAYGRRPEIIIDNGGDIFIYPGEDTAAAPVIMGIFSGLVSKFSNLALKVTPSPIGTAICSSSGKMGHSLSLGNCDLCTVVSENASLADAAATMGGNLVSAEKDLVDAAEKIVAIRGITGVLIIKNDNIAIAGKIPELVKHIDRKEVEKISGTFII